MQRKVSFQPLSIRGYTIQKIVSRERRKFMTLALKDGKRYVLKFSQNSNETFFLSKINFRRILKPVEVFKYMKYFVLVCEVLKCDLYTLLERTSVGETIGLPVGLRIMMGCTEAIHFLHNKLILHGDIKLENFLIDYNGDAILCDFENARILTNQNDRIYPSTNDDHLTSPNHQIGSSKSNSTENNYSNSDFYNPPEFHGDNGFSFPADVYALGVALKFIWARTQKSNSVDPNRITELIDSMTSNSESLRPTAAEAHINLGRIVFQEAAHFKSNVPIRLNERKPLINA